MSTGSFVSAARAGKMTNWAIARPPGQTQALRPVIALHGLGGSASAVMDGGVEQGLAQAVNAGLPPFAVVSVDGGSSYWHQRARTRGQWCSTSSFRYWTPSGWTPPG